VITNASGRRDITGHLCSAVHNMESVTISTFANVGTDLLSKLALPRTYLFVSLMLFFFPSTNKISMRNRRVLTSFMLIVIMLPILVLKNLTFRKSALWGWLFILFIGSISIVAAIVRYGALKAVWGQPKASITHTIDVSSMVEITTSLLAVCSPSLRVFFRGRKKPHRPIQRDVRDISTDPDMISTIKSATDPRESDVDSQKHLSPVPEDQLASSEDLPIDSGTSTLTSFTPSV